MLKRYKQKASSKTRQTKIQASKKRDARLKSVINNAQLSDRKRKRGKTKLNKVLEAPSGQKLQVECNDHGQPVGENANTFTSFCGIIARNTEVAPLNYDRWDSMPRSFKEKHLALLKEYFEFPDAMTHWINASINRKWRDYKGELKAEYYDEMLSIGDNLANLPPGVPSYQWIHLVNYFESKEGKKFAELGRKGRKCQKALHTTGSKSFAKKRYEMEQQSGRTIGAVEFYLATHKHKDGRFVDDDARKVAEQATKELDGMNISLESSSEDAIRLQQEAISRVRGKEHCGRVRGLGLGPTPTQVFGSSRFSAIMLNQSSQEVNRLRNRVVELESEVALIPELKSQVATIPLLEARMNSLMAILQTKFPDINIPLQPEVDNSSEDETTSSTPSTSSV